VPKFQNTLFHHHRWCKQEELTNTGKWIYLKLVLACLNIRSTFNVEKNTGHYMRRPVRVTACISKFNLSCMYPSEECLEQICCDSFHMFRIMNRDDFSNLGLKHTIMMMTMMIIIAQKKTLITTNVYYYNYYYIHTHTHIYIYIYINGKSSYNLFKPKWVIIR
jgi:hypothetical protein